MKCASDCKKARNEQPAEAIYGKCVAALPAPGATLPRIAAMTYREFWPRYLAGHANKTLSHRELLQAVWGPDYGDQVDYLRVFVNQLRKKIEVRPSSPVFLLTEPWVGYRLHVPAGDQKS